MKNWHKALVCGLAASVLVGCSGGSDPKPAAGAASATETATAAEGTEATEGDNPWCEQGDVTDELEVTFGEMAAASDEWAEDLDREWRHYFPVTITNVSDKPCVFIVKLDAAVEGGDTGNEDLTIPLDPGQSYHAQAFDLEVLTEFSGDSEDATPTSDITPSVYSLSRAPLLDYYETELDVEGVVGTGATAKLVSHITMIGRNAQMPDRIASADDDTVTIVGLDAEGDVIAKGTTVIEPVEDGETATVETLAGGGDSSMNVRNQVPLSNYDDVVTWEIAMLQPVYTEIHEIGL
ncbi:hypothetical protein [Sanguibacter suaedae]|uniref:Uncharacterized protein n=1 Tax=Sanguibacter suaedae TaxID=2795737 RepID=A0A934I5F7_9MICO|nr:hypothetical protein [Sanguibacter suaedae]MBI9115939.1 hypothetical protein [Sanguibacter suaedae]